MPPLFFMLILSMETAMPMQVFNRKTLCFASFIISLMALPSFSVAETLSASEKAIASADAAGRASQKKVEGLDDESQRLLNEYRQLKAETDQLRLYNEQMSRIVANQEQELSSLDRQISEIERTEQGVLPLMLRMLDNLESFVELDTPFLPNERESRVALLKDMMSRADVTTSEKFRRVLEAYQVEVDYGRNIEAYRGQLNNVAYDFLRIGRVALYRLSNDGTEAWIWDRNTRDWNTLDAAYQQDLRKALKVAQQTAAPELLTLPMPIVQSGVTAQ
ncbi:DUF3450 domain-containing protein [Bacterioplanoides sp. SCSIO 12839]|uniref:DUF3450 domain-containing protein n=1 Tax=Bacterioplanoides sp. SCSIO 12839 TaxID=2829569 RepID=UPI0021067883|nr:DUF3450 domain-containing protein [Bacterioplanoides sp. SCSIO 12839]UTW49912.1 DUF3450 domain-containing protein [Bacterioplanoides sp. SCSIO 12839]